MDPIIHEICRAHGGAERWKRLGSIEAVISARGFLLTAKRRPRLNRVRVRASTRTPRFAFLDFPATGQTGELIGDAEVRITDRSGEIVARRQNPRAAFRGFAHAFSWDDLDFIYFGGYATWNYLTIPFLFLRDGFEIVACEPIGTVTAGWTRLRVTFPDDIPTHCPTQEFFFDRDYLLRRIDYTAEIVGRWAHAAHFCEGYRDFSGLRAPSRRRVLPLPFGRRPLPAPTLVALDIHEINPVEAAAPGPAAERGNGVG